VRFLYRFRGDNLCWRATWGLGDTIFSLFEAMEDSTVEDLPKKNGWPIYLYIPNLIGKQFLTSSEFSSDPPLSVLISPNL